MQLLYPTSCLHCGIKELDSSRPLCTNCLSLLELIHPEQRCSRCFNELSGSRCPCTKKFSSCIRIAAVFEYHGPVTSLLQNAKENGLPHLAKGIASWMAVQLITLSWPLPDCIVPVPSSFLSRWHRGYCLCTLIAKELGNIFQRKVAFCLHKHHGYSQSKLDMKSRENLQAGFSWKGKDYIQDQTVLLIDDLIVSGQTVRRCGEALLTSHPKNVYAMAFAMDLA